MVVVFASRKPNHPRKRLHAKLDHLLHHHHQNEAESLLEPLRDFRAELSDGLRGLIANSKEFSLIWVDQGLKLLHGLNSAFAMLIESVDCPMSEWESPLVDEYLGYTLEVLDLFNQMSSSLSRLQSVRLALAHAIGSPSSSSRRLLQSDHHHSPRKWASQEESGSKGDGGAGALHGKQGFVLQAVVEMKGVALWVCRVVVCGLGGEIKVGNEMPVVLGVDSRVCGEMVEEGRVFKEVREVNQMVDGLLAATVMTPEESTEMKRKLERFQSKLEEAVEEVNCLFSEVLASRNRLMDCFRLH